MVNSTIFVQALNFFITYFVLQRLFFRPTITVIDKEDAYESALRANIVSQRAHVTQIVQHQREQWDESRERFAKYIPAIDRFYQIPTEQVEGVWLQPVSTELKQKLIKQVKASIIKRVHNV